MKKSSLSCLLLGKAFFKSFLTVNCGEINPRDIWRETFKSQQRVWPLVALTNFEFQQADHGDRALVQVHISPKAYYRTQWPSVILGRSTFRSVMLPMAVGTSFAFDIRRYKLYVASIFPVSCTVSNSTHIRIESRLFLGINCFLREIFWCSCWNQLSIFQGFTSQPK